MKLKNLVKSAIPVVTAAAGAYFGGPSGASAGYGLGNSLTGGSGSSLLNGLVQGAVGLGTDYLDGQMQLDNQKKILGWQLENNLALKDKELAVNQQLQNDAFKQNVEMWNLQNQYNDPSAQMQRLRNAGLNPNLVYGGGNVAGLTTSNAPQISAPEYSAPSMGRPETPQSRTFDRVMDAMSKYQQVRNQELTNEYTRQKIALLERAEDRRDLITQSKLDSMHSAYKLPAVEEKETKRNWKAEQEALDKDWAQEVKEWKLAEGVHKANMTRKQWIASKLGIKSDEWYNKHPFPKRRHPKITGQVIRKKK